MVRRWFLKIICNHLNYTRNIRVSDFLNRNEKYLCGLKRLDLNSGKYAFTQVLCVPEDSRFI